MLYIVAVVALAAVGCLYFLNRYLLHGGQVEARGKVVVVTGCDTGFGNTLARQLDNLGYRVIAGFLDVTSQSALDLTKTTNNVSALQLDVTSEDQVDVATQRVTSELHGIGVWALVNNAGLAIFGETEWCTMEAYERILNVNLMGTIRVSKSFLPLLRKSRGRVINMVSLSGRCGLPGLSAYTASKFGIIGFSDCLRREMMKFHVKVITIEPTLYRTNITDQNMLATQCERLWSTAPRAVLEDYGDFYFRSYVEKMKQSLQRCSRRTDVVIRDMVHAVTSKYPRSRYVPKWKIRVLSDLLLMLPDSIQDWLIDTNMSVSITKPKCVSRIPGP
ncbi:hypothetical protein ScPMuIL_004981 [Solemya velum]